MIQKISLFISFVCVVSSLELPSEITICHKSDPKLATCIENAMSQAVKAFKNGYEPLDLPRIDPYFASRFVMVQSKTNKNFHLTLTFKDLNLIGLADTQFKNVKVNLKDDEITIKGDVIIPELIMDGKYHMYGKLLLFALRANDKAIIKLKNAKGSIELTLTQDEVNGVKYYIVKQMIYNEALPEEIILNFSNLVKGNPKLSQQINKALQENVEQLNDVYKESIEKFFVELFQHEASKIFTIVPMEKILPP